MWRDADTPDPVFTDMLELDLSTVQPCIAGPKRPQDRVLLKDARHAFTAELTKGLGVPANDVGQARRSPARNYEIGHGDVVIAAITSCTNTSNPYVMLAAGLVARKARAQGLTPKPWVKTSLAPGSQVVTEYLDKSGLTEDLDALGFQLVGYGCTTCIGNSGPLDDADRRRDRGQQAGRRLRAVRQPQLRGPRAARTCAPTTWPARRWWSPTRCSAP